MRVLVKLLGDKMKRYILALLLTRTAAIAGFSLGSGMLDKLISDTTAAAKSRSELQSTISF